MNPPLLAFAFGIALLQLQPALPPWPWLGLLAALAGAMVLLRGGHRPWPARLGLCCLAACLGFAWAGWRAETRLAERLAPALEGQDLALSGTITAL
ncbi:MAG TPA: DUF4131 domain-containing protein, partial [Azospira sp.]|nr:DUF4131 domain-containing protein [Azospira sp.]